MKTRSVASIAISAVLLLAVASSARIIMRGNNPPGAGGAVNLPYGVPDQQGNQWMVYPGGWIQQQGNMQIYNQGAMTNGPFRLNRYPSGARELRRLLASSRFPSFAPEWAGGSRPAPPMGSGSEPTGR